MRYIRAAIAALSLGSAVAVAIPALPARAESHQMTVTELRTLCGGPGTDRQACEFYIYGVAEGANLGANASRGASGPAFSQRPKGEVPICIPDALPMSAMVDVVTSMLTADIKRYPEDATTAAVGFIVAALVTTYPCPK